MQSEAIMTPYGPMPARYKCVKLADVCAEIGGVQTGPFGSQLHQRDYVSSGTPIITVEHLGDNRIVHQGLPRVSEKDRQRLSRYSLKHGDIVFSRVGSVDLRALVRKQEEGWLFSGRCLRVRPKPELVDPGYLSWFFGLPAFRQYVRSIAYGATMPSLNTKLLSELPIYYPELPEQRAIAHILGTLDDKIELNRRMNQTLEAMAQALFKSWFVDFEPFRNQGMQDSPLGEIPLGWGVGRVDDIAVLHRESVNPSDYPDETFDHYSIPAFDEGRIPKVEIGEEIKSNKFRIPNEAVLISKLNPRFPRIWLPFDSNSQRSVCSTEFLVVTPVENSTREYIYSLFCSKSFLETFTMLVTGTSSSHQRVRPEDLMAINIAIPPEKVTINFSDTVRSLLTLVNRNIVQNNTLASIRDALLPKLLSGEIQIKGAEKFVENKV